MASDITAFAPLYTATGPNSGQTGTLVASVTLAATGTAQAVTLPSGQGSNMLLISNQGTTWAYVNFGIAGAVTAATAAASLPVAPGLQRVFNIATEVTGASCLLASGTGSVTFTRGIGL